MASTRRRNDGSTDDRPVGQVVAIGLTITILLVIATLMISLYETVVSSEDGSSVLNDPEVVAVAIGLVLSVLFVERWRSLESKVDTLTSEQYRRLHDIEEDAREEAKKIVGDSVDKADRLSEKLASIHESHPWLEVITQRDIIVETNSVRGILRTAYTLLKDGKHLHVYEYLEFCLAEKDLRGTPDDFYELACLCELWLEDYALSTQFLSKYVSARTGGHILVPDLVLRLMRTGSLDSAKRHIEELEATLRVDRLYTRHPWYRLVPFAMPRPLVTERFRWQACNAVALVHQAFDDKQKAREFTEQARASSYAEMFAGEQFVWLAEMALSRGDFAAAREHLADAEAADQDVYRLRDLVFMYERMGEYEKAMPLRDEIERRRNRMFGDIGAGFNSPNGDERGQTQPTGGRSGNDTRHGAGPVREPGAARRPGHASGKAPSHGGPDEPPPPPGNGRP